jgi:TRAP-type mannitol/chloroaromatic compound transport system substrate-binding protein
MGKMKQMFEQQESINQLNNNKMTKKTMQQKLRKQPEPIVETRKEALRRLYKENGLTEEDIYKDKRGFVIITRTGIDKIVSRNKITVARKPNGRW